MLFTLISIEYFFYHRNIKKIYNLFIKLPILATSVVFSTNQLNFLFDKICAVIEILFLRKDDEIQFKDLYFSDFAIIMQLPLSHPGRVLVCYQVRLFKMVSILKKKKKKEMSFILRQCSITLEHNYLEDLN